MTATIATLNQGAMAPDGRRAMLERLRWLFDAPMFIDRALVERLHDIFAAESSGSDARGPLTLGGGETEEVGDLLARLSASALRRAQQGEHGLGHNAARDEGAPRDGREDRKLRRIVLEYLCHFPERMVFRDTPGGEYRNIRGVISKQAMAAMMGTLPRPLVFIEKRSEALLFPIEAELRQSEFRSEFKRLDGMPLGGFGPAPDYPGDGGGEERLGAYWAAIRARLCSNAALQALRTVCGEGRIAWIDFRLQLLPESQTARLHLAPDPGFPGGQLSGDFLQRANVYGCRIIGTLKSGNDINVLAIYEL